MSSTKAKLQACSWTRDEFFISTDPTLLSIPRLIEVFDSDDFYWAKSAPAPDMLEMIENSLSFGLYERTPSDNNDSTANPSSTSKFIGFARCITDFVTFAYLTDVWVDSKYRTKGLGRWLVQCIAEVLDPLPYLRRTMLLTGDWERSVPFYEKFMKMELMDSERGKGLAVMRSKGRGHPG